MNPYSFKAANQGGTEQNKGTEEKQNVETPQVPKADAPEKTFEEQHNEDVNAPYTDVRSVTIALVTDHSLYRKVNDKALLRRVDYIGSSINSSRMLAANKGEVEAYFPNIVGVAANHESFVTRVKQYLNNIAIKVDVFGKTFDTSFVYNHKSDYYAIKEKEEAINAEYDKVSRNNIIALRAALKRKIDAINSLESTKYLYGHPINVDDYLMYRHCLIYNDVAKDMAFINVDSNIRFYFKDNVKEAEREAKKRKELNKAKANYVSCLGDSTLFESVYIQYCLYHNLPVMPSLADTDIAKESNLDKFSAEQPELFNKLVSDSDIKLKGTIEKLIARGELIRLPNNQNITTATGQFIGSNMKETVAWFKNPDNTSAVNAFNAKLKL